MKKILKFCYFCDKIIIPTEIVTTEQVCNFFKNKNIPYTLNYVKTRSNIGKRIICTECEKDLIKIVFNNDMFMKNLFNRFLEDDFNNFMKREKED